MRVTITAGTGGCKHITVKNASTGAVIGVFNRDEIIDAWQDWTAGDKPYNFVTRACQLVNDALASGAIAKPLTVAKAMNYLESVEL